MTPLQTAGQKYQYFPNIGVGVDGQCSVWLRTGRQGLDRRQTQRVFPLDSVPPSLLSNRYDGTFPLVKRGRSVTLTTYTP
jgi:hypothetical protein